MNKSLVDEKNIRLKKYIEKMKFSNINLTFITSSVSIYYFTGILITPYERLVVLLILENGKMIFLIPKLEEERVKKESKKLSQHLEIISWADDENAVLKLNNAVETLNIPAISCIAVEKKNINLDIYEKISDAFPNTKWENADGILESLRLLKSEEEIKYINSAVKYTDRAFEYFFKYLKPGKKESEMVDVVSTYFKKLGTKIWDSYFNVQVVSGKKSANPHGIPGKRKIKEGDFVILDMGVKVNGYCSDMTRTFIIGDYSIKQKEIYETVLNAQRAAIDIVKPGIPIQKVDEVARSYIESKGYGRYFIHRIGHGIGLEVHEEPSLSAQNKNLLNEGMVFTIEPGIYIPEIGGVRIEDDILVTKKEAKVMGNYPKDFKNCVKSI